MTVTREEVLEVARRWFEERPVPAPFVPGETYIPPSGKVLRAQDLAGLVDASLDLWLTAGRYGSTLREIRPFPREGFSLHVVITGQIP